MSALAGGFLWLLPLALLPVIIHLLNRLRYQTVRWAAMMFLRSEDRDASRRARIRQWLILAARCLMLLAFLLALARLQSKGRLASFFNSDSNMVMVLFDRSASMEQLRGGVSGRERALDLVQQGLSELGPGTRVLWVDSATGEMIPVPAGVELARLPFVAPTSTPADLPALYRTAMREVARAGVSTAEIWIPSDLQISSWIPGGVANSDASEWEGLNAQVTVRVLNVSEIPADSGNRALQLAGEPRHVGDELRVPLRMLRDRPDPESVPLQIDAGGLRFREDVMVEGRSFSWEQRLVLEPDQEELGLRFSLPADSHPTDHQVVAVWKQAVATRTWVEVVDPLVQEVVRASVLPIAGTREVVRTLDAMGDFPGLWVRTSNRAWTEVEGNWVRSGGVCLELPESQDAQSLSGEGGLGVDRWNEASGVLATVNQEPLRLDLVRVFKAVELETDGIEVLSWMENGIPFLTREEVGEGVVYRLATLPEEECSTLSDGFVWVPVIQRLLSESRQRSNRGGNRFLGDWQLGESEQWDAVDVDGSPGQVVGRYRAGAVDLALNRPEVEDRMETLSLEKVADWATPFPVQAFSATVEDLDPDASRVELTSVLALLGLVFLALESWLLTQNIRRSARAVSVSSWSPAT